MTFCVKMHTRVTLIFGIESRNIDSRIGSAAHSLTPSLFVALFSSF